MLINDNKMIRPKKINVPTNYRNASKILSEVIENKKNVKSLILGNSHMRKDKGFAMMDMILNNLKAIDELILKTKILEEQPKLNKWLAKVLIAELIFGRGQLSGESLPVKCVLSYQDKLMEAFQNADMKPAERIKEKGPRYVRINSNALNLVGAHRLLADEGWILIDQTFKDYDEFLKRIQKLDDSEYVVDFHFKDLLVFPNSSRKYWAKNVEHRNKFVQQNKACLLPTILLDPKKKSVVLDMCAAPGNKTTHIANLMKNKGRIYAVERNIERYKVLCENSAEFGVIKTIHDDCLSLTDEQVPGVEYILLDPSCSGSGRSNQLNEEIDAARLYKLQGLQYKLLRHALMTFPNVSRVVYSTCSLREEENEKVVQDVLSHCSNFKLIHAGEALGLEWKNFGSTNFKGVGEKCLYARPEVDLTDGMFVAVLERCGENEVNDIYAAHEKQKESYGNVNRMMSRQDKKKSRKKDQGENLEIAEENNEELISSENSKAFENDKEILDIDNSEAPEKEGKKKKKRKNEEGNDNEGNSENSKALDCDNENGDQKKIKKSKSKVIQEVEPAYSIVESLALPESNDMKKKKRKNKEMNDNEEQENDKSLKAPENIDQNVPSKKEKKKKNKNKEAILDEKVQMAEESLKYENLDEISSKKEKRKNKDEASNVETLENDEEIVEIIPKKKKKSKKLDQHD